MSESTSLPLKLVFAGLTDVGVLRSVNQDAFYVDEPAGRYFIVADGMGGHAGGQEASRLAIDIIRNYLEEHWQSPESSYMLLKAAFLKANRAILQDQREHPERADMGTTALTLIFRGDEVWCAHIGDSRLYRLRGAKLDQLTEDHTWVARALRVGTITPAQARTHPWRHVLSQCLGRADLRQIDISALDLQPGDRLLLCSDGLTEELSDTMIAHHLKTIRSCEKVTQVLVEAAKENGGRDNITVVVVAIEMD
ncbi:Stp1/IreP family PP2C-type Ser/Thr phosphatase [Trichothermofontia sichuanensis]|uniref:Stp1/IreP family PP2C-type Ser/Thr phosphatase n=1 Tax=Trichothermofontia sichuanensis TaxID=3045816 RepID=UPI00249F61EA